MGSSEEQKLAKHLEVPYLDEKFSQKVWPLVANNFAENYAKGVSE